MLEGFFRSHLLGKRVSRFKCQNVVLLCLGAVILFLSKEFMDLFHISRSSYIRRCFHVLSYCLLEGFKVSEVCFIIYLGVVSQFLLKVFYGYFDSHFQEVRYQSLFLKVLLSEVFKLSFCFSKIY